MTLNSLLNQAIVYDIETYAEDEYGNEVDIQTQHDKYLSLAKVKWVGIYSFKDNKEYYLEVTKDREKIQALFRNAYFLIGFNSEDFDFPILVNNGLINTYQKCRHVDVMKILGSNSFRDKNGYKYKGRGELMDYKFNRNSLRCMAETMGCKFQKSTIDYTIFRKDKYTEKERKDVIKYLKNDVMATKELFEKLWDYWKPFTELIDWKDVQNLSWIRSSIASLTYKSACFAMGVEPTYSEKKGKKEKMGGNVLLPKYEEARDVWYVDFASLYPHVMCMFNLFSETSNKEAWHGNDMFKVRGYYDVSHKHILCREVEKRLKERIELKQKYGKDYPMVYALKIFCNSLYGASRSSIFEKIHTPNIGWDTCYLSQQIQKFTQNELEKYGFESVYGDTDSLMVVSKEDKHLDKDYIKVCLKKIVKKIKDNVPFPVDTFSIDIEDFIYYITFPFSDEPIIEEEIRKKLNKEIIEGYREEEIDKKKCIVREEDNKVVKKGRSWVKERTGNKKNYLYLYEKNGQSQIKLVGLPIKKDGATELGMKFYKEVLEPKILQEKRAKFSQVFIDTELEKYLKRKDIISLLAREFKVKPYHTYKVPKGQKEATGIHAQISKGYFGGGSGVISLIKNKKVGKAGKSTLYCTVDEAIEAKLNLKDLDLKKLYNELNPFILFDKP